MVSCVMLSYTVDIKYQIMTQTAIDTLVDADDVDYSIILVETNMQPIEYKNAKVIQPGIPFNYNEFLNIGLSYCPKSDYYIISNNDVIFYKNWFTNIRKAMEKYDLDSASPFDVKWVLHQEMPMQEVCIGYRTEREITGWCIVAKENTLKKIGPFDTQFVWWYQDNDYAMNLKKHNLRHGLVFESKIFHLNHQSGKLVKNFKNSTENMEKLFTKKWMENEERV